MLDDDPGDWLKRYFSPRPREPRFSPLPPGPSPEQTAELARRLRLDAYLDAPPDSQLAELERLGRLS